MRRMQKITGRSDDMMIIRGVNVFPSQIEELILKQPNLAPHYQCVLTKEGPLDALAVHVEPAAGATAQAGDARALENDIKIYIGVTAKVHLAPEGAIERSMGKAKRVVDKR